jgi:thioredoxin-like negative regulator of GroEL
VVQSVEQIEGVRFAALFAQLPQKAKDGDEAIAAVWEMVVKAQDARHKAQDVLAQMPEAVRTAIEAGDTQALSAALRAMPEEEAQAIIAQLRAAGIISGG